MPNIHTNDPLPERHDGAMRTVVELRFTDADGTEYDPVPAGAIDTLAKGGYSAHLIGVGDLLAALAQHVGRQILQDVRDAQARDAQQARLN